MRWQGEALRGCSGSWAGSSQLLGASWWPSSTIPLHMGNAFLVISILRYDEHKSALTGFYGKAPYFGNRSEIFSLLGNTLHLVNGSVFFTYCNGSLTFLYLLEYCEPYDSVLWAILSNTLFHYKHLVTSPTT